MVDVCYYSPMVGKRMAQNDWSPQLRSAVDDLRQGRLASAERTLGTILKAQPGHLDALVMSGVIAGQSRQPLRALDFFNRALQLAPENPMLLNNKGLALLELGKLREALAAFDTAIALKPDSSMGYFNRGNVLRMLKRPTDALESYSRALDLDHEFAEACFNRATVLHEQGELEASLADYDRAISIRTGYAEAFCNRAHVLRDMGRHESALASVDQAITLKEDLAAAHAVRGNLLADRDRFAEALDSFDRATALDPSDAEAYSHRGAVLRALGQLAAALDSCDRAIALRPADAEAHMNRGNVLRQMRHFDAAHDSYERAIALKPNYVQAVVNRGGVLRDLMRLDAALACCEQALEIDPGSAEAHFVRGDVLHQLRRLEEARASYGRAIALKADFAEAYSNLGNLLRDLRQPEAALASFEVALSLSPQFAEAHSNRGNALRDLGQLTAALASYDRALEVKPDLAEAHSNRGNVLRDLAQPEAAVASYRRAIARRDDLAEAHQNLGDALCGLRDFRAAVASYDRALELEPDLPFILGQRRHARMHLCDWQDLESDLARLTDGIMRGFPVVPPLALLALSDSASLQRRAAQTWDAARRQASAFRPIPIHRAHERIRVGYFSADFHSHATSYLIAGLFEAHDRTRFEVSAFSFGPDRADSFRHRIAAACDRFVDVRLSADRDVAQLARDLEIDIAVDLKGYTEGNREGIFALRAAPIQVSFLGYPGTLAADYMDYLIADGVTIPRNRQYDYSEKIIYLPHSYQVNDVRRTAASARFTRADVGLPTSGFVFNCFNNSYKILPSTFDRWMRILSRVEGSVLWLLEDNASAADNLRREAARRGVDPGRLVFARRTSPDEHLARHLLADLVLDTLPYNAHTTGSDALWAGVPLLTCPGEAFASRVGASLLSAVGLPDLIAADMDEYESLAVDLATDPRRLADVKRRLGSNRLRMPLFDTVGYARDLESAYTTVHERHRAGLPAESIEIPQH